MFLRSVDLSAIVISPPSFPYYANSAFVQRASTNPEKKLSKQKLLTLPSKETKITQFSEELAIGLQHGVQV